MFCEPADERRRSTQSIDAKFSVPFTIALAALNQKVVIGDFLPDSLKNDKVIRMAEKVECLLNPALDKKEVASAIVEIIAKDSLVQIRFLNNPYFGQQNEPGGMVGPLDLMK
jgi:2-methylcitrate dehydratase PrpD